jgi:hypothetical protein
MMLELPSSCKSVPLTFRRQRAAQGPLLPTRQVVADRLISYVACAWRVYRGGSDTTPGGSDKPGCAVKDLLVK